MTFDPNTLAALGNLPLAALLIAVIIAGARKLWVFGWVYKDKCEESDRWQSIALNGTNIAERAVQVADQATKQVT